MSSKLRFFESNYLGVALQRRHVNSCKYPCRKLLFVLRFIFFNFLFAALQLFSSYYVYERQTPDPQN